MELLKRANDGLYCQSSSVSIFDLRQFFSQIDKAVFVDFQEVVWTSGMHIVPYDLVKKRTESEVLDNLHTENKLAITSIGDIYLLMKKHKSGTKMFKENGASNFFFVNNKRGESRQLAVVFMTDGAHLKYYYMEHKNLWLPGRRIFGKPPN